MDANKSPTLEELLINENARLRIALIKIKELTVRGLVWRIADEALRAIAAANDR